VFLTALKMLSVPSISTSCKLSSPFHGDNTGSNPVRDATLSRAQAIRIKLVGSPNMSEEPVI
jgi:hypothetical protein